MNKPRKAVGLCKRCTIGSVACAWFLSLALSPVSTSSGKQESEQPLNQVKVLKQAGGWRLIRNGQPYFVKGAGGLGDLNLLKNCGANATRIWGIEETTPQRLDEAHRLGLTVIVGIWLGHERHGFQYSDQEAVKQQFDQVLEAVKRFKDHPAVLMWGIGNEMEGAGNNPKIWQHIEQLCAAIKSIDPNHPTMTAIAELGESKVASIHQHCPSLDIIGINSYGNVCSVPKRYREQGGSKPYLVTEFGPPGAWEVTKNAIGAVEEETSTAKAPFYERAYDAIVADQEFCLGTVAFVWGNKQEATATWFGLLLPDGNRTAALDRLTEKWTGKSAVNLCPRIDRFQLNGNLEAKPESLVKLELAVTDPEQDPLTVRWVLMEEANSYNTGGDFQATPRSFPDNIISGDAKGATIKLPQHDGLFRIYAFISDGHGGGACANQPIRVWGAKRQPGVKVQLPLVIYDEPTEPGAYAASGWIGNSAQLKLNPETQTNPHQGRQCLECNYLDAAGWAGVVWQHPVNDWGDKPDGFDISGAKELVFWARGEHGEEQVKFGYGILGAEKKFPDSSGTHAVIQLTGEWKRYSIDLSDKNLNCIKTGFYWIVEGQGKPIKFYLDAIQYE